MRLREEEEEEEVGRETREVMGRVILRLASSLRPPPPLPPVRYGVLHRPRKFVVGDAAISLPFTTGRGYVTLYSCGFKEI